MPWGLGHCLRRALHRHRHRHHGHQLTSAPAAAPSTCGGRPAAGLVAWAGAAAAAAHTSSSSQEGQPHHVPFIGRFYHCSLLLLLLLAAPTRTSPAPPRPPAAPPPLRIPLPPSCSGPEPQGRPAQDPCGEDGALRGGAGGPTVCWTAASRACGRACSAWCLTMHDAVCGTRAQGDGPAAICTCAQALALPSPITSLRPSSHACIDCALLLWHVAFAWAWVCGMMRHAFASLHLLRSSTPRASAPPSPTTPAQPLLWTSPPVPLLSGASASLPRACRLRCSSRCLPPLAPSPSRRPSRRRPCRRRMSRRWRRSRWGVWGGGGPGGWGAGG